MVTSWGHVKERLKTIFSCVYVVVVVGGVKMCWAGLQLHEEPGELPADGGVQKVSCLSETVLLSGLSVAESHPPSMRFLNQERKVLFEFEGC